MGGKKINKPALYCSNMALLLPRRFQGFLNAGMGAAVSLWGVRGRATADGSGEAITHIVLLKQMFSVLLFKKKTASIYAARL